MGGMKESDAIFSTKLRYAEEFGATKYAKLGKEAQNNPTIELTLKNLQDGAEIAGSDLIREAPFKEFVKSLGDLTDKEAAEMFARIQAGEVVELTVKGNGLKAYSTAGDLVGAISETFATDLPNVVEASGSPSAMKTIMTIAPSAAKVLILGDYGDARADFQWNHLLWREYHLIGSNASAGAWPEAVRLATTHKINLERLISHRLQSSDFEKAIMLARTDRSAVKVVMEW